MAAITTTVSMIYVNNTKRAFKKIERIIPGAQCFAKDKSKYLLLGENYVRIIRRVQIITDPDSGALILIKR